jgi:hypothetical protein
MAEEITVTSDREKPYPRRAQAGGLSPLQAGLLYGGAGAAIGGPVGLLAGLFAGIVAKRGQESYLDRVARDTHNYRREYAGLQDTIDSELQVADPDEARLLSDAKRIAADGWYRLESGDETGRAMIEQANETIRGIMNSDIQARKAEQASQFNTQRGLITSAAPALRDQYSGIINNARQLDSQAQRILELTSDPSFDPNKPFHKAILAELVSTSMAGMFREDPNGLLNGLAELGGSGSEIGTIIATLARAGKAVADTDEFKISREEYNRVALNIREVTRRYGMQRLQEIEQQASGLDAWAKQVGAIPNDYSLRDYVSGGVRELQVAPAISVPAITPTDSKQPSAALRSAPQWQPRRNRPQVQAPTLAPLDQPAAWSDDWFRQKLGVPTTAEAQRRRRPTN